MEIQIKKTVKSGNSSAVILPRSWLNKEVRIELVKKTDEIILCNVINILKEYISLKEIIGIYLTGSYARGEEDETSDIDILVITTNIDKEMITEGIYNISVISQGLLDQKLERDLFPTGQMIRESRPLLNSNYLNSIKVEVTNKNVKWYLDTTEEKINLIKKIINKIKNKKQISNKLVYTLILRIRTLYIIKKIIENKSYSKKELLNILRKVSGGINSYKIYLAVKTNSKTNSEVDIEEIEKLYEYLKRQLKDVKKMVK